MPEKEFDMVAIGQVAEMGYDVSEFIDRIPEGVELKSFSPQHLEELMNKKGFDQKALAKESGIKQQNISNFIRGKSSPREEDLRKLGKALGVLFISDWLDDGWEKETPRYKKQQGDD